MSRGGVPVHVALSSDWSRTVIAIWLVLGAGLGAAPAASSQATSGTTPVADAARAGDFATVRSLLAAGEDANGAHGDGMSALHWAAERNDAEMARALIHAGAAVDAATRIDPRVGGAVPSTKGVIES